MTDTYHDICAEAELANGQSMAQLLNGWPILVTRSEDRVYAVINRCTHAEAQLQEGRIRRSMVSCPLHGARFELATGKCVGAPYLPLKTFPARIADGRIEVAVPDAAPGKEHQPVRSDATPD
ncbi:MAG: Rieske 2Fe-2S domain-containing protein [Novosphingobium sp.]